MAKRAGVSRSSVSRLWRAFELKPHRQETFTLSTDDFFVEKNSGHSRAVYEPTRPCCGPVWTRNPQSERCNGRSRCYPSTSASAFRGLKPTPDGTTNLFAALDHVTGEVIDEC